MRHVLLLASLALSMSIPCYGALAQSPIEGHWVNPKTRESLDITVVGESVTVTHPTATGTVKVNRGILTDPETARVETKQGAMTLHAEGSTLTLEAAGKTGYFTR
jgi:hypothetical protein